MNIYRTIVYEYIFLYSLLYIVFIQYFRFLFYTTSMFNGVSGRYRACRGDYTVSAHPDHASLSLRSKSRGRSGQEHQRPGAEGRPDMTHGMFFFLNKHDFVNMYKCDELFARKNAAKLAVYVI